MVKEPKSDSEVTLVKGKMSDSPTPKPVFADQDEDMQDIEVDLNSLSLVDISQDMQVSDFDSIMDTCESVNEQSRRQHVLCSSRDQGRLFTGVAENSLIHSDIVRSETEGHAIEYNAALLNQIIHSQPDRRNMNSVAVPRSNPVFLSIDEGYNSQSFISTDRHPFLETCDNKKEMSANVSVDAIRIYSQDKDGDTSLHVGIIQKEVQLVFKFIASAPSSDWLNMTNLLLQTPLHLAVVTRQRDVVRRLMVSGATVDVSDIHGNTPLHIACREGYVDLVQCLLTPVRYEETVHSNYAVPFQRIPQDLNRRNCEGLTCLHLAAKSTHLSVLELLLEKRADVNVRDGCSGRTVLHMAAETGNRILLEFLLSKRKLDICCQTYGGLSPLKLSAGRGFGDIVSILISHGADVVGADDSSSSEDDTGGQFYTTCTRHGRSV